MHTANIFDDEDDKHMLHLPYRRGRNTSLEYTHYAADRGEIAPL